MVRVYLGRAGFAVAWWRALTSQSGRKSLTRGGAIWGSTRTEDHSGEGAALAICRARRPPGQEEVCDACSARERTDDAARRCAAAGQMARARIELATPRFSVVDRGATAEHGRRRPAKISLQIASVTSIATCGPLSRDTALVRARGRQVDVRGARSARSARMPTRPGESVPTMGKGDSPRRCAGLPVVVPRRSQLDVGPDARMHAIAGVAVAPMVMQRPDRRHSAIRTR